MRKVAEEPMYVPVLVLNANFEPINVCNTRRAIGLMMTGKASLVLNGRGEIKTVSQTFPRPSIIRLERMIKRPRPRRIPLPVLRIPDTALDPRSRRPAPPGRAAYLGQPGGSLPTVQPSQGRAHARTGPDA